MHYKIGVEFFVLVGLIRHNFKVNQRVNLTIPVQNIQRIEECVYHSFKKDSVYNDQSIFEEIVSKKTQYNHITRFRKREKYSFYLTCLDINHQVVDNTASKFIYNVYGGYTLIDLSLSCRRKSTGFWPLIMTRCFHTLISNLYLHHLNFYIVN